MLLRTGLISILLLIAFPFFVPAQQKGSAAVDVNITRLVDGNAGVHAMLPKAIFVKH